jgi:hypothetical protein
MIDFVYDIRRITEIAYSFGFSSSGQFLRAFRTRFAMTPSEARQECQTFVLMDREIGRVHDHCFKQAERLKLLARAWRTVWTTGRGLRRHSRCALVLPFSATGSLTRLLLHTNPNQAPGSSRSLLFG